jgi:multidrug efflux pump subunit AcrA (membrane-fusion protein)
VIAAGEGKASVMVVGKDNVAHQVEVKVGIREGNKVQILEGVKPGDTVVAAGAYGLAEGTKVQLPPPEPADDKGGKSGAKED